MVKHLTVKHKRHELSGYDCPDPVRILELEIMASHSHQTDRANSKGGGNCGMASKPTCFG